MRVGLVLGGGGVIGGAWMTGALEALGLETGFDATCAEYVVGTSAGAMVGALAGSGVPAWFMHAHAAGESFDGLLDASGRAASEAPRSAGAVFRPDRGRPPLGPGSVRLGLSSLSRPHRHSLTALLAGWAPEGVVSTEPLKDTIRRVVPWGWSDHPNLWIMSCEYDAGRRVAFGRADAPPAHLADAVAASCAIPGFYRPVRIGGRRFVDGGVCSASNLDVLRAERLDLAICLSPSSSLEMAGTHWPLGLAASAVRGAIGRRLGFEARKLRAAGTEVLTLQPTAEDLATMGHNLLATHNRVDIIEAACRSVARALRAPEARELVAGLPQGEPHRISKPAGHPSRWPEVLPRRAAARAPGVRAGRRPPATVTPLPGLERATA